ncbi:hypothetical protein P170DRAFT_511217 [Aspergillus steynii IBT 23096]|uniref:Uncharacterized protein n=1 Tax=Aspergillus steynii IBT 23096 TaxID=1392250 RepID=A0A2I2G0P1_9EURO|nr:uncharacterized protein P170DRAFT_511217 [Aspergillus steynii IBT 23096]PLB46447.1 hypothetical protein P170DRAFT_511217 [Aspergillus steynii IBT 23096]
MSVIGKIQGALASLSNENVLALANLNFDFSLFKMEPPQEFTGLGNALSARRKEDAEEGLYHRIARRLGALFEGVIPPTPELIRAYGKRVSEISEAPGINPKGSKDDGLFENMIGADGTSIWAAATSGSGAIPVHMLACMLARMWKSDEATSIWVEIVEKRKQIIKEGCESLEPRHWASLLASQQEITRKDLAHWDASARAWLNRADEARAHQQTQLMLVVKNLDIDVSSVRGTYENVMDAWTLALTTVNSLVKGMPQTGHDGAVLLGLASWHLYPALNVLSLGQDLIDLKDNLVPHTGIITLGLNAANPGPGEGVRWSLPLAHLRFYGEPVELTTTISRSAERLHMPDLLQVILGCALAGWGYSTPRKADPIIQILAELWSFLNRGKGLLLQDMNSCFEKITHLQDEEKLETDNEVKNAQEKAKQDMKRRMQVLTGDETDTIEPLPEPIYTEKRKMLKEEIDGLKEQADHDRAALLRLEEILDEHNPTWPILLARTAYEFNCAEGVKRAQYEMLQALGTRQSEFLGPPPQETQPAFGLTDERVISLISNNLEEQIELFRDLSKILAVPNQLIIKYALADEFPGYLRTHRNTCGLASAVVSNKRDYAGNVLCEPRRWIALDKDIDIDSRRNIEEAWISWRTQLGVHDTFDPTSQRISTSRTEYGTGFTWLKAEPDPAHEAPWMADSSTLSGETGTLYNPLCGDPEYAALYFAGEYPKAPGKDLEAARAMSLTLALKTDRVSIVRLLSLFNQVSLPYDHPHSQAIRGACAAAKIYQAIPTAKLSLRSLMLPLHEANWIPRPEPQVDSQNSPEDHLPYDTGLIWQDEYITSDPGPYILPLFETAGVHDGGFILSNIRLLDFSRGQLKQRLALPKEGEEFWTQWKAPELNRSHAFACIVYFESGSHNHDPEGYKSVMAVSCGDSIYAAESLFSDPYTVPKDFLIKRLIGNIGHPGVVLLVPPACPMVRASNICDPFSVRHAAFDGRLMDKFPKTQLELSFTGYSESIRSKDRGACDTTVYVLEAQVRVYDGGSWVGDLDVLAALDSPILQRPLSSDGDAQDSSEDSSVELASIDRWEELLQPPPTRVGIIRAHGNWLARLAAASLSVQKGYSTMLQNDLHISQSSDLQYVKSNFRYHLLAQSLVKPSEHGPQKLLRSTDLTMVACNASEAMQSRSVSGRNISEGVPFYLGNQAGALRITDFADPAILRPSYHTLASRRNHSPQAPKEHRSHIIAQGPWHIMSPLSRLLTFFLEDDGELMATFLQPGQYEWIREQSLRVATLLRIPLVDTGDENGGMLSFNSTRGSIDTRVEDLAKRVRKSAVFMSGP